MEGHTNKFFMTDTAKSESGFTLIEMLIVIAIISILESKILNAHSPVKMEGS